MAKKYLEIGVSEGKTFIDIATDDRTAVDPQFSFDTSTIADDKTHFHPLPSDRYFSQLERSTEFDIIFIDGLHRFEQVVIDFSNAVVYSHAKSVTIFDDTTLQQRVFCNSKRFGLNMLQTDRRRQRHLMAWGRLQDSFFIFTSFGPPLAIER